MLLRLPDDVTAIVNADRFERNGRTVLMRRAGSPGPLLTFDRAPSSVTLSDVDLDNGGSGEPAILFPAGTRNAAITGVAIAGFHNGAALVFAGGREGNENITLREVSLLGDTHGNAEGLVCMNPLGFEMTDCTLVRCGSLKLETNSGFTGPAGDIRVASTRFEDIGSTGILLRTNATSRMERAEIVDCWFAEIGREVGKGAVVVGQARASGGTIRQVRIARCRVQGWGTSAGYGLGIHGGGCRLEEITIEDNEIDGAGVDGALPATGTYGIWTTGTAEAPVDGLRIHPESRRAREASAEDHAAVHPRRGPRLGYDRPGRTGTNRPLAGRHPSFIGQRGCPGAPVRRPRLWGRRLRNGRHHGARARHGRPGELDRQRVRRQSVRRAARQSRQRPAARGALPVERPARQQRRAALQCRRPDRRTNQHRRGQQLRRGPLSRRGGRPRGRGCSADYTLTVAAGPRVVDGARLPSEQ
ncbi:MAG: hypothetical protein U0531_13405 [Dehalococcoidia bacterium]